jgi:hypothetical protein
MANGLRRRVVSRPSPSLAAAAPSLVCYQPRRAPSLAASPLVAATTSPRAHPIPASGAVVRQPGARRAPPGRCAVTRAVAASFSLGLFSNLK